jgi:hypothetical protein
MDDMLQEAIAGEPVMVSLARASYPLAYPMQAVILYRQETAKIDRERAKAKIAAGGKPLTRDEKRELRDRRRELLAEADTQRPLQGVAWDDNKWQRFEELLAEAVSIKATVDEDAGTGDSLYDKTTWWKISPEKDPERMLLALWVGLHEFKTQLSAGGPAERVYSPRLSKMQLAELVGLDNGEELTVGIANALRKHLIAPPAVAPMESDDPNPQPPAMPVEYTAEMLSSK